MNLAAIVEGHPEEALALRDHGAILTYGQLRSRVGSLRASLRGLGVEAGDRVAIAIANDSLFVVSYLAVLGVAAVAVPLNPDSPPAELEAQLAAVDVKLTIAAPSGADAARAIDRSGQVVEGLLVRPNGGSAADRPAVPSGAAPVAVVERAEGDLAVLMFTAGTAGAPKAAALSHGNLLANLEQVQRHPGRALNTSDVVLGVLPMFHIF